MQAAIATSSISPYMWIVSGPRSTVPLCGEGNAATGKVTRAILPAEAVARSLEQDPERQLGLAALLEQPDRHVQVDVRARGELGRVLRRVAGPLELLVPPALDPLRLGLVVDLDFCRRHRSPF